LRAFAVGVVQAHLVAVPDGGAQLAESGARAGGGLEAEREQRRVRHQMAEPLRQRVLDLGQRVVGGAGQGRVAPGPDAAVVTPRRAEALHDLNRRSARRMDGW
jgi:hypothetical protein